MDSNELKAKAVVGAANQRVGAPQITPDMLRNSQSIICDCGGMIFAEKLFFKKMSALISHSGKEELAPMPIIVCENCKRVPRLFDSNDILPEEIKAVKNETPDFQGEPDCNP